MKRNNTVSSEFIPIKKLNAEYDLVLPDNEIDLLEFVRCVELALTSGDIRLCCLALRSICTVSKYTGAPFARISGTIVRSVLDAKEVPQEWKWEVLLQLNRTLGISSGVYLHFSSFANLLMQHLNNKEEIPKLLLELVPSIMSTSLALLNARTLLELQKLVCSKALISQPNIHLLSLLNTFLKYNHDEVPAPVQITKSIFERCINLRSTSHRTLFNECMEIINFYTRNRLPVQGSIDKVTDQHIIPSDGDSCDSNSDVEEGVDVETVLSSFHP